MGKIIIVTGASSGFGALAARRLADAGHTVYAGMRETAGRNAAQVEAVRAYANENEVDLRSVDLDVQSEASAEAAIARIMTECGRLDVVIHNAGHMSSAPRRLSRPSSSWPSTTSTCWARSG
jgi:NAD(P)-dependent dehydrogenase (short-subunit alcohol dehydrogenase family)